MPRLPQGWLSIRKDSAIHRDDAIPGSEDARPRDGVIPGSDDPITSDDAIPGSNDPLTSDDAIPGSDDPITRDDAIPGSDDAILRDDAIPGSDDPITRAGAIPGRDDAIPRDGEEFVLKWMNMYCCLSGLCILNVPYLPQGLVPQVYAFRIEYTYNFRVTEVCWFICGYVNVNQVHALG